MSEFLNSPPIDSIRAQLSEIPWSHRQEASVRRRFALGLGVPVGLVLVSALLGAGRVSLGGGFSAGGDTTVSMALAIGDKETAMDTIPQVLRDNTRGKGDIWSFPHEEPVFADGQFIFYFVVGNEPPNITAGFHSNPRSINVTREETP